MKHIDGAVKIRNFLNDFLMRASLAGEGSQSGKTRIRASLDLGGRDKYRSFLRNVDRAYLPRPIVEITKLKMMNGSVMRKVKFPCNWLLVKKTGLA